jgi:hypothetical protein
MQPASLRIIALALAGIAAASSGAADQTAPPRSLTAARAAAASACDIEIRAHCTGLAGDKAMACLRGLSHPVGSRCKTAMDDLARLSPAR